MKIIKSKILIVSLLISSLLLGNISGLSSAYAADDEYGIMLISANIATTTIGEDIVETALYLEELHPSRASGSDEEAAAAETLAQMLEERGFDKIYTTYIDEFLYTPLIDTSGESTVTDQRKTSRNVVGYINNNKEQTIIIGAHYDNYANEGEDENTGFYCNLLGVSAALEIATQLAAQEDLQYNIMVAFWGAAEDGFHGSEYFVSTLSNDELSKVALYVNLDMLAVGDSLYIFTNETADLHESTFIEEAENLGYELNAAPDDKQYTFAVLSERPFMHLGIQSDNFYFTTNEVMCANFLSYVWEDGAMLETLSDDNIMYTSNDNSTYIFDVHTKEEIENNMTEVSQIILATLTRDDIVSILQTSKEESTVVEVFYDDSFSTIVAVALIAIFAVILILQIRKVGKEVKLPESETEHSTPVKVESIEVFGETVILEDGALKRNPNRENNDGSGSDNFDNTPKNPFDF